LNQSDLSSINSKIKLLEEQIAKCNVYNPVRPTSKPSCNSKIVDPPGTAKAEHAGPSGSPSKTRKDDLDTSKCVVLHSFENKSLLVNNVAIRHRISALLDDPVITFLNQYDKNDPKLFIHFEKQSSAENLLKMWKPVSEKCQIRPLKKPTFRPEGICFGVPTYITDDELLQYVQNEYSSCDKVIRFLSKDQQPLATVKLVFQDKVELDTAIENGIYLKELCLKIKVQLAHPPKPKPIQCFKCWGYSHIAAKCTATAKTCKRCNGKISCEDDHKLCDRPIKCSNCGSGEHQASDHSKCPSYINLSRKLSSRGGLMSV
jgi:hypothetical protein